MEKSNSGMHGHGMPAQEMPTNSRKTTTIHESKHFPFQIIEMLTFDNEDNLVEKTFKIGAMGAFMSEKTFTRKCDAEKHISSRPWELITNIMCLTIQNAFKYEKSKS